MEPKSNQCSRKNTPFSEPFFFKCIKHTILLLTARGQCVTSAKLGCAMVGNV